MTNYFDEPVAATYDDDRDPRFTAEALARETGFLGNLADQDAQVACFENAARHLRPGGCFVVETAVPGVSVLAPGQRYRVFDHADDHVGVDEYDAVTQLFSSHHYSRQPDGSYRRRSIPFRYAWPAEMDLMARIAGMRLRERWSDWERQPFRTTSPAHVSVWQRTLTRDERSRK